MKFLVNLFKKIRIFKNNDKSHNLEDKSDKSTKNNHKKEDKIKVNKKDESKNKHSEVYSQDFIDYDGMGDQGRFNDINKKR